MENNEYNFYTINDCDIVATKLNLVSTLIWYESNIAEINEASDIKWISGSDKTYFPKNELSIEELKQFINYLTDDEKYHNSYAITYNDLVRVILGAQNNKDVFLVSSYE